MRVAVLYEQSRTVAAAFEAGGHWAVSVDLAAAQNDNGPHVQMDALAFLASAAARDIDLFICHPPCTYLSGSGLHWNKRVHGREACTLWALSNVRRLFAALDALVAERVALRLAGDPRPPVRWCIENPVGAIGTAIRAASQTIQPFNFGEDASKRTCLWLHGLPPLRPTGRIAGRIIPDDRAQLSLFGQAGLERWANQSDSGQNRLPETDDRWLIRSTTYPGIARAMADQWGAISV